MNFLSGCLINRIFDVELKKEYDLDLPLKIQKEISQEKGNKSQTNKKIEHCQNFTVTKNLKEIYNSVFFISFLSSFILFIHKIMTAFKENQPIDVAITDPELGLRVKDLIFFVFELIIKIWYSDIYLLIISL